MIDPSATGKWQDMMISKIHRKDVFNIGNLAGKI